MFRFEIRLVLWVRHEIIRSVVRTKIVFSRAQKSAQKVLQLYQIQGVLNYLNILVRKASKTNHQKVRNECDKTDGTPRVLLALLSNAIVVLFDDTVQSKSAKNTNFFFLSVRFTKNLLLVPSEKILTRTLLY